MNRLQATKKEDLIMAHTTNIGVFNADGSNHHPDITPTKLDELIEGNLLGSFNHLLTFTEFQPTARQKLSEKLKEKSESFEGYGGRFKSSDYSASFWNEAFWKPRYIDGKYDLIWSDVGKYGGVVLEHEGGRKEILYLSVHLPKKDTNKKKMQEGLVGKAIDDLQTQVELTGENVDAVVIAGDFNMSPSRVHQQFGSDYVLAIDNDEVLTTVAGNSIDNVITTDAIRAKVTPLYSFKNLSHIPLFGQLQFRDDVADEQQDKDDERSD